MDDLRFAVRMLVKSPAFTLSVVGLLALGIGANTIIFSALNALLLKPLPVHRPEELIRFVQTIPRVGTTSEFPKELYEAFRHAGTLQSVVGDAELPVAMNDPKPAELVRVHLVTPEFFEVLGVPALRGRTLGADDARGELSAVLSYRFWKRRFAGDVNAVGRTITLRGIKFTVVGIMPRDFNGITTDTAPDMRIPLHASGLLLGHNDKSGMGLELAARLKPGVTLAS
jgi:hypothetical protein